MKPSEAAEILKGIEEFEGNLPEDGLLVEEAWGMAIATLEKLEQSCDTCKNDGLPFCHLCSAQHKNFYERKEEGK